MAVWITALAVALAILSTALSTAAVILARRPTKRDVRLSAVEADLDDLRHRVQRLQGRIGRQKQIDDGEAASDDNRDTKQRPGETPDEWKARMRLRLHAAKDRR